MMKVFKFICGAIVAVFIGVTAFVCYDNGLYQNTWNNITQQEETEEPAEEADDPGQSDIEVITPEDGE